VIGTTCGLQSVHVLKLEILTMDSPVEEINLLSCESQGSSTEVIDLIDADDTV
jgi:hypothetical protein